MWRGNFVRVLCSDWIIPEEDSRVLHVKIGPHLIAVFILIHSSLDSLSDEALGEVSKAYRNMVGVLFYHCYKPASRLSERKKENKGRTQYSNF